LEGDFGGEEWREDLPARGFAEQRENPARAPARIRSPQLSPTGSKAYNRCEESSTSLGARAPTVDEGDDGRAVELFADLALQTLGFSDLPSQTIDSPIYHSKRGRFAYLATVTSLLLAPPVISFFPISSTSAKSAKSSPHLSRCFRQVENSHFLSDRSSSPALAALPKSSLTATQLPAQRGRGRTAVAPPLPSLTAAVLVAAQQLSQRSRGRTAAAPPLTAAQQLSQRGQGPPAPRGRARCRAEAGAEGLGSSPPVWGR